MFAACGSAEPPDCELGGPYRFQGGEQKVANFLGYQGKDLFFSEGVLLKQDQNLLQDSVSSDQVNTANRHSTLKYNYVVSADDCEIYVATWTKSTDEIEGHLQSKDIPCVSPYHPLDATRSRMINFWPEDNDISTSSPCWLDKDQKDGLLDAMSKHFILAQKPGSRPIERMILEPRGDSAVHRSVAYGGEIVVDLNHCTYTVNNGSGTYRPLDHDAALPDESLSYLKTVAQQFRADLGVAPTFVQSSEPVKPPHAPVRVEDINQKIPGCVPMSGPASDTP